MDLNKESSKKHAVARYEGKTKIQAIVKSVFLAVCWICLVSIHVPCLHMYRTFGKFLTAIFFTDLLTTSFLVISGTENESD